MKKWLTIAIVFNCLLLVGAYFYSQQYKSKVNAELTIQKDEVAEESQSPALDPVPIVKEIATGSLEQEAVDLQPTQSELVVNLATSELIYGGNIDQPLGIASISKIFSLVVVLDEIRAGHMSYHDRYTVPAHYFDKYASISGLMRSGIEVGQTYTIKDLLYAMMIQSGNDATLALAYATSGSEEHMLQKINQKIETLGLEKTTLDNILGLTVGEEYNQSTTRELAITIQAILRDYPDIVEMTQLPVYTMSTGQKVYATNHLLKGMSHYHPEVNGFKTGFTPESGNTLLATLNHDGNLYAVLLLNYDGVGETKGTYKFDYAKWLIQTYIHS